MADMMARALAWQAAKLKKHVSGSITYTRGDLSVTVAAVKGKTPFNVDNGNGMITVVESADFIVTAADLRLSGAVITPVPGDVIVQRIAGVTYTHEVMNTPNESCWKWDNDYRILRRIHAKQVSEG